MRIFLTVLILFIQLNILACNVDVQIVEGSTVSICQGTSINATAGFASYSWTGPQTGNGVTLTPLSSGTYTVEATDVIGCVSSASIQVTVNSNPVGVIVSSEGNFICPGNASVLSFTQAFSSYLWSDGSTQPTLSISQGGVYSVAVTDVNGCIGNSSITINQPNFTISNSKPDMCLGYTTTLTATGGVSYLWSNGATGSTIIVGPTETTTYTVEITNAVCTGTLSETVNVVAIPLTNCQDTYYVKEGEYAFMEGPDDYESYLWSPATDITLTSEQETIFTGLESTTYLLVSTHENGCLRSDVINVFVVRLTVPTGFSPNGDGINDTFVIPELGLYDKSRITIYNRWGDIVYETLDYQNDWNGTCQSDFCIGAGDLPEGTYYYHIEAKGISFDGFTTLKR